MIQHIALQSFCFLLTSECVEFMSNRLMVRNPIYEGGAIYEEIPGMKGSEPLSLNSDKERGNEKEGAYAIIPNFDAVNMDCPKLPVSQQLCTMTLHTPAITYQAHEETYTVMNSVGPLIREQSEAATDADTERSQEANDRYVIMSNC